MSIQHCFKDQGKKVKKINYISFFHIFICLSFVLIGCQTNNFDVFNLTENTNYDYNINKKNFFSDLKLSAPKYKSFSSNNAQANVKKAIRAHPSFHRNVASLEQRKSDIKHKTYLEAVHELETLEHDGELIKPNIIDFLEQKFKK